MELENNLQEKESKNKKHSKRRKSKKEKKSNNNDEKLKSEKKSKRKSPNKENQHSSNSMGTEPPPPYEYCNAEVQTPIWLVDLQVRTERDRALLAEKKLLDMEKEIQNMERGTKHIEGENTETVHNLKLLDNLLSLKETEEQALELKKQLESQSEATQAALQEKENNAVAFQSEKQLISARLTRLEEELQRQVNRAETAESELESLISQLNPNHETQNKLEEEHERLRDSFTKINLELEQEKQKVEMMEKMLQTQNDNNVTSLQQRLQMEWEKSEKLQQQIEQQNEQLDILDKDNSSLMSQNQQLLKVIEDMQAAGVERTEWNITKNKNREKEDEDSKKNMDKEFATWGMQSEYDGVKEAKSWIESILNIKLSDFHSDLQSGVILCSLINKIRQGSITKVHTIKTPFMQMENIQQFITACESFGVSKQELFRTIDLFEAKNLPQVASCVLSLRRVLIRSELLSK